MTFRQAALMLFYLLSGVGLLILTYTYGGAVSSFRYMGF
jgi:hypothetical protein